MGRMKHRKKYLALTAVALFMASHVHIAEAKLDCGPATNRSDALPRTAAIGTNPAGTGAHAIASALAAIASKATPIGAKVQPYNGPNAWMPLLENGEIEMGIINILDSHMAATGTGNYKTAYPSLRVISGGVFPFTAGLITRDKLDVKQISDLKGKRLAWDYGGHAINQTWQNAVMEAGGLKPSDVQQVRVSNLNDGVRAVPEGKVDAAFTAVGIGVVEEANAMEPIRFVSMPNSDGYPLQLVSSAKVSDKTIATLLKAWWDNLAELQTIHPLLKRWTKDTQALTNFTVPYHSGAVRFYKEVGIWSAKHEARTKEICG